MAAVPLLAGFIAKEAAYEAFTGDPFQASAVVLAVAVGGSMLTVAYAARFHWGAFVAPRRQARRATGAPSAGTPAWPFVAPAAVLALGSVVLGTFPSVGDRLVTADVRDVYPGARAVHLALWHGPNLALALSVLTLAGGWAISVGNRRAQKVLATGAAVPRGEEVYLVALRVLGTTARRVTGVVQNGSLPVYTGVILATAAVLPTVAYLGAWEWPGWPAARDAGDLPIAVMLVVAAVGAATVRRRFSAAVLLSAAGYAMAALFVAYGAPDLALTQVAVETLSTVVFVLVLRRLPDRFERQSSLRRRVSRLGIAGLVGAFVFAFAIVAGGSRTAAPVSEEMLARSVPDGHGRNVVNVILVDFRGLDTMGEITVLALASIGAVALARVGRGGPQAAAAWGTRSRDDEARRIVFVDVPVQLIFHALLMASLWLLFAGHNQPGGGFVGGLLAGSAITMRYVAGGITEVRARSRFKPWNVLGTGILLASGTAGAPLLTGGAVLDVASASLSFPLVGELSLSSALLFDAGVYLTVVGMVLMAYEAFGDEPAEVPA
jgi:multicomponent Na+:H+ antiporter subunit A